MNIPQRGAFAFSSTVAASKPDAPAFDRSKVFMVCIQNFDDHRRLSVAMLGGARFEVDSRTFPYDIDKAADWLVGGE
ncbi:hypothetical protein O999_12620 [Pseudomonas putida LF54]|uniref:hypothetical protein n=1 Tax=Pseudomonas putida TaxID=303 RepID=UPI0003AEEB14|nr:hypothetical protein [Pseudomonas putida]ERK99287.1 hypothetical protein O999_12620 [Pseudomonas putida LF54]